MSSPRQGALTLITGCMFSGKTSELLRRIAAVRPSESLVIKHAADDRFCASQIVSHAGEAIPARTVFLAEEILSHVRSQTRSVFLDEAHFFDAGLIDVVSWLTLSGMDMVLTTLEPDSWGVSFPINQRLRQFADDCVEKTASCAQCGSAARFTQRLTPILGGRMVVDPSNYEPRCESCWRPPLEDRDRVIALQDAATRSNSPVTQ